MKNWFSITNKAEAAAEISIHDEIGFWGVTAKDFVAALNAVGPLRDIVLNIDCPGGDCGDGFTIYDAIKTHKASVSANITGFAGSMASVVMLAADKGKLRIAENGRVMIHRVSGGAHGNADDLSAAAKVVEQFENRIVALYTERTGKTETEIRDMMKAEMGTWFFGQEAVDAGFADAVIPGAKAKAFRNEWAAKFQMLPAALFREQKESVDNLVNAPKQSTHLNKMAKPTTPTELETTPVETPPATPQPEPTPEPAPVASGQVTITADADELRAEGAAAERKRIADIRTWAKSVEKMQNINLASAVDTFLANGKPLADFKEHVITNTFKVAPITTPTDSAGAQGKTISRSEFDKMDDTARSEYLKAGGRISKE